MELNDNRLPFLDILITKSGKKVWLNFSLKSTDSNCNVSYLSNHPKLSLKNTPFCLARRICIIVENIKPRETYGNLQTSKTLDKTFAKHKLIDCKRQPSNLKRLSCSSNFSTNKPTFKTTKCG